MEKLLSTVPEDEQEYFYKPDKTFRTNKTNVLNHYLRCSTKVSHDVVKNLIISGEIDFKESCFLHRAANNNSTTFNTFKLLIEAGAYSKNNLFLFSYRNPLMIYLQKTKIPCIKIV